jgi:hypothetical protein
VLTGRAKESGMNVLPAQIRGCMRFFPGQGSGNENDEEGYCNRNRKAIGLWSNMFFKE